MFVEKEIKGNIVALRSFDEKDITFWNEWDTDPEVQKHMPEPRNEALSSSEQLEYFGDCMVSEDELHATIILNETGQPIGTVSITGIVTHHGVGEIGIVIGDKGKWGKGVATEAISLILQEAQKTLRRITAEFEKDNVAMQKSLEKNGFELEAICVRSRIRNGQEIDTVRMVKFFK